MKIMNWLVAIVCSAFLFSCGGNSSNNEKKNNYEDTAARTVDTLPAVESPTVNISVNVPERLHTVFMAQHPRAIGVTWKRFEPEERFDWGWTGWQKMDTSDYVVKYTDD